MSTGMDTTPDVGTGPREHLTPAGGARIPVSTYRVQFQPAFTFADAARVSGYLRRLGVGDLYGSPCLGARPGSPHGYDIADHSRLNADLGGEEAFAELSRALTEHGMGLMLDFVPNHMGVDDAAANRWWWDVLENGICSPFSRYFDIDWDPVKDELQGRVLLPFLGDQYGRVLERGELALTYADGALVLRYFERTLPINPRRMPLVLRHGLEALQKAADDDDLDLRELLSVMTALDNLPSKAESDPARIAERQREKEVARERLARLAERSARIRDHIESCVRAFNGTPGDPHSFDGLHRLLEGQAYRLAYWRTAFHEINYRRFFDVNGLASLRMEDAEVFAATHGLLLRLVAERMISGLRLDHIDGLYDPAAYLDQLQAAARDLGRPAGADAERAPGPGHPLYLVGEKILSPGERLPPQWALHGTTGYEFLNLLNGLFVDPARGRALHRIYTRFTRRPADFDEVTYQSKRTVMESTLASEINLLAHALNRVSECDRRWRDFTLNSLHDMLVEVVACFPVYRTYVRPAGHTEEDVRLLETAVTRARRRNPTMDDSIFEFFLDTMLDRDPADLDPVERRKRLEFAMKFQQYTGPVQAKGLEDTAFYRHFPLLSQNEVGGSPERIGHTAAEFHAANLERHRQWPYAMLCTATHDTKRGEDARARLDVLSEIPEEWNRVVTRWSRLAAANRTRVGDEWAPDRGDEYLFFQALLGAWPPGEPDLVALAGRLRAYMAKAIREAKLHTSWINQNGAYEQAVSDYVEGALVGRRSAAFLEAFAPFARRVGALGAVNSLGQLALKIAAPGVPDFYQGTELWNLTLVDPDNRQPVDFERRTAMLAELEPLLEGRVPAGERGGRVRELLERWEDGRIKLLLTAAGLRLRRARPALFLDGDYRALAAEGALAAHVVAFARAHRGEVAVVVVPRLCVQLGGGAPPLGLAAWGDTRLPLPPDLASAPLVDAVTGQIAQPRDGALELGRVLADCPVALLATAARDG